MKKLMALILSIIMVLSLVACGGGNDKAENKGNDKTSTSTSTSDKKDEGKKEEATEARTVVIRTPDIFQSLNPWEATGYSDGFIFNHVYETLFYVDDEGQLIPVLATGYTASDDALTYTINLVEDAVYTDGTPFTAKDVVFTYTYAKDFTVGTANHSMVESVTAIDDYTVEFKLNTVDPLFLAYTGGMPIVSEKFVTENDGNIAGKVCGTGPYDLVSYDPAVKAVLTAKEDYRLGAAEIKDFEIQYVADASSALVSFEAGALDLMAIPAEMVTSIQDSGKFNTERSTPMHTAIIALNNTVAPLDNKLVRQALSYACNKEAMVMVAYEGQADVARLQANTNCFGVDFSEAPDISYNPEKAKELLAEAGYPDGLNFADFGIHMDVIAGGYHEKIAQVFQQNLADIGVTLELVSTEIPDEKAASGDYAILNEGMSYRADFSYNKRHYGSIDGYTNWFRMEDEYVNEMFIKGDLETDPEKRKDIYRELIAYIVDYCPNIPVFHKSSVYGWSKDIDGVQIYDNSARPYFVYEWKWA